MTKANKGGRPKNSGGYDEAKDLIKLNNKLIVQKAIALATHKKYPNVALLTKLLDKVLPTLTLGAMDVDATIDDGLKRIPEPALKNLILEFANYDADEVKPVKAKVTVSKKKKRKK